MPRIRTIKPEALIHRKVGRLSDRAFRLWIACLTQADDQGRLVFDADQFRVLVWGFHVEVRASDVSTALLELVASGLVRGYVDKSRTTYLDFPSWTDHQRVDHARKSQLPEWNEETSKEFFYLARVRARSRSLAKPREASTRIDRSIDRTIRARARGQRSGHPARADPGEDRSSFSSSPDQDSGEDHPARSRQARAGSPARAWPMTVVVSRLMDTLESRDATLRELVPRRDETEEI